MVATYRSSDTSPKERFVHQQAGDGGYGGSSYIDLLAFREKDANTAWTSASDGTLEERLYYCQNQHADVVALITAAGTQREMDRYSAYGVPFGLPVGDVDSDGACLIADQNQVRDWAIASPPAYDVRGDLDLDGDVDLTDRNTLRDDFKGVTLGRGVLSAALVSNQRGVAGYVSAKADPTLYLIRHRVFPSALGQWATRDPIGHVDGATLYEYLAESPAGKRDPQGLKAEHPPKCVAKPPKTKPTGVLYICGGYVALELVMDCKPGVVQGDCDSGHCSWECEGKLKTSVVNLTPGAAHLEGFTAGSAFQACVYEHFHGVPVGGVSTWPKWESTCPMGVLINKPSIPAPMNGKSTQQIRVKFGPTDCGDGSEKCTYTMIAAKGGRISVEVELNCNCEH